MGTKGTPPPKEKANFHRQPSETMQGTGGDKGDGGDTDGCPWEFVFVFGGGVPSVLHCPPSVPSVPCI